MQRWCEKNQVAREESIYLRLRNHNGNLLAAKLLDCTCVLLLHNLSTTTSHDNAVSFWSGWQGLAWRDAVAAWYWEIFRSRVERGPFAASIKNRSDVLKLLSEYSAGRYWVSFALLPIFHRKYGKKFTLTSHIVLGHDHWSAKAYI